MALSRTPVAVDRSGMASTASASSTVSAALGSRFSTFGSSRSDAGLDPTWSLRTAHLKNALMGSSRAFWLRKLSGSPSALR